MLDLGLPHSQGLETFHKVSKAASHIPVIILTGNDDQAVAVAAVRDGAQDYLVKCQIGGSLLTRAVRYAVERKRAEEALIEKTTMLDNILRLIQARILAVADVVEAMASHRPYRPGLGIEAALSEIEKNRGIFYDAAVTDACLRLFREKGFQLEVT